MSDDPDHPSNFKGKLFYGNDITDFAKQRNSANPLYQGTDLEAIKRVEDRIDALKREGEIPTSYTVHDSLQLLPDRVLDTTNRSAVLTGQRFNFDPEGFRQGKPLQRHIFYLDPFMTCQWCNMLTYVDVISIRRSLHLPVDIKEELQIPLEEMPPCRKCGKADYLFVGSHDFSDIIANRDRLAREKFERELAATLVIQKYYRAYLRRMYAHAEAQARLALKKLQDKAAIRINATARRKLAYRRFQAEYHLAVIKTSHPVLLQNALKPPKKPDRRYNHKLKTFWFDRDVELKMVFEDYIQLGNRIGWNPTRKQMEVNFVELSKRITARKDDLLSLIQRAWRGFMARRIVMFYRTEVVRLQQFLLSKAFKIQRLYRGHRVRLHMPTMIKESNDQEPLDNYLNMREKQIRRKQFKDSILKTKNAYIKERAEERTARFTQRIDEMSLHNQKKMVAFAASCYADDRLPNEMARLLDMQLMDIHEEKMKIESDLDRKQFIMDRIAEHGPEGYGQRGFIPEGEDKFISGIAVGPDRISSRSKGMKHLLHEEVLDIMEGVFERAAHDFKPFKSLERMKFFNHEKQLEIDQQKRAKETQEREAKEASEREEAMRQRDEEKKLKQTQPRLGNLLNRTASGGNLKNLRDGNSSPGSPSHGGGSPEGRGRVAIGRGKMQTGGGWQKEKKEKKIARRFKNYKFPKAVYDDPMAILNEDLDIILAYQDKKAKEKQKAGNENDNERSLSPVQRQKAELKKKQDNML